MVSTETPPGRAPPVRAPPVWKPPPKLTVSLNSARVPIRVPEASAFSRRAISSASAPARSASVRSASACPPPSTRDRRASFSLTGPSCCSASVRGSGSAARSSFLGSAAPLSSPESRPASPASAFSRRGSLAAPDGSREPSLALSSLRSAARVPARELSAEVSSLMVFLRLSAGRCWARSTRPPGTAAARYARGRAGDGRGRGGHRKGHDGRGRCAPLDLPRYDVVQSPCTSTLPLNTWAFLINAALICAPDRPWAATASSTSRRISVSNPESSSMCAAS
jgi:hypothetical protein